MLEVVIKNNNSGRNVSAAHTTTGKWEGIPLAAKGKAHTC